MSSITIAMLAMVLQSSFFAVNCSDSLIDADAPLFCLSCSSVISPRHCHNIVKCAIGQVCYTEEFTNYNGEKLYNIGCHSRSFCNSTNIIGSPLESSYNHITQCVECCEDNACNSHGCNSTGYPETRGPLCFSCQQTRDPSLCRTVQVCNDDEICHIHEIVEFGERFYSSSCLQRQVCDVYKPGGIFGRKRYVQTCSTCCALDLCNYKCHLPFDCLDIYQNVEQRTGVYSIYPSRNPNQPVRVKCDMELLGGGWTVIQTRDRNNPVVDFNTTWNAYKVGFGEVHGNYWLGNDLIHLLTTSYNYSLHIQMKKINNQNPYEAHYSSFSISDEADGYRLHLGKFSGSITDEFRRHVVVNQPFLTFDHDNIHRCARNSGSGWWYNHCTFNNLNAPFFESHENWVWLSVISKGTELLSSEMLIKR